MARGRKRKRIRERVQIVESRRDISREQEVLNSQVRQDGQGEDSVIKALLFDLPTATEVEAKEIALALQKLVRGDASLLANEGELSHIIADIRKEASFIDKQSAAWDIGPEAFVESVMMDAPKMSDKKKGELQAYGADMLKKAISTSKAGKTVKQMQFREQLKNSPLETIYVTGKTFQTKQGPVIRPDEVSIMGLRFELEPGIQKVPAPVARAYNLLLAQRNTVLERQALMQGVGAKEGTYHHDALLQKLELLEG